MTGPRPPIGFIGLGTMGAPMCRRLTQAGYQVHVFDLRPDRVETAVKDGAIAGTSARMVAAEADLLLTSLPRPDDVEAVMRGADGALAALRAGSLWIDLSTNRRELMLALASEAPAEVAVADAPVTGAVDGARHGHLTVFIGGDPDDAARARPVLEHLGQVIECGPLGTGTVTKLVTNQLWFIHAAALGEGFAVGMQHGVDLAVLWKAMKRSVADSFVARHDAPSVFAGHYDASFTLGLCLKDLELTRELAASVGADLPMTTTAHEAFAVATERYGPDAGEMHVAKRIEDDAGLSFRLSGNWIPPWEQ
jgi:3-hydroxyisobutyrate dehydrogenase-like beta-hydroxyacid dehydrogenase